RRQPSQDKRRLQHVEVSPDGARRDLRVARELADIEHLACPQSRQLEHLAKSNEVRDLGEGSHVALKVRLLVAAEPQGRVFDVTEANGRKPSSENLARSDGLEAGVLRDLSRLEEFRKESLPACGSSQLASRERVEIQV